MDSARPDLISMDRDNELKNGRGFIDPHQSRSVDVPQLTDSGFENMDFWADRFNDMMTRNSLDATLPLFEDSQTGKRSVSASFLIVTPLI